MEVQIAEEIIPDLIQELLNLRMGKNIALYLENLEPDSRVRDPLNWHDEYLNCRFCIKAQMTTGGQGKSILLTAIIEYSPFETHNFTIHEERIRAIPNELIKQSIKKIFSKRKIKI